VEKEMSERIYQSSSSSELHSETLEVTFSGVPGTVCGEYDGVMGPMGFVHQRSSSLSLEEPKMS
jgi:hypothetical protein